VQNAETLAHLALIARYGAEWFRELGTAEDPGSALVTLSGSVEAAGVYEIEHGQPLASVLEPARVTEPLRAVLIGGYFGSWVPATAIATARLAPGTLREHGASLGAGVIVALGESACPVAEVARVARWFSEQSAGQCGPCVNGLGAIAEAFDAVATGAASSTDLGRLERWAREIVGRGACRHPDGAARFLRSAFDVFGPEIEAHARRGPCERCDRAPVLPLPSAALVS
jgi:NADH:ubiquinone oxidoreductase subunit F (NADH-binding)